MFKGLRRILVLLLLTAVGLPGLANKLEARTWEVCQDPDSCSINTIQAGIDSAVTGDTVLVTDYGATYSENLLIDGKDITLMSVNGSSRIKVQDANGSNVLCIKDSNVGVNGFTFDGGAYNGQDLVLVKREDRETEVSISNCIFLNEVSGVSIRNGARAFIDNCQSYLQVALGLRIYGSSDVTVTNTIVSYNPPPGFLGLEVSEFDTIPDTYLAYLGIGQAPGENNSVELQNVELGKYDEPPQSFNGTLLNTLPPAIELKGNVYIWAPMEEVTYRSDILAEMIAAQDSTNPCLVNINGIKDGLDDGYGPARVCWSSNLDYCWPTAGVKPSKNSKRTTWGMIKSLYK